MIYYLQLDFKSSKISEDLLKTRDIRFWIDVCLKHFSVARFIKVHDVFSLFKYGNEVVLRGTIVFASLDANCTFLKRSRIKNTDTFSIVCLTFHCVCDTRVSTVIGRMAQLGSISAFDWFFSYRCSRCEILQWSSERHLLVISVIYASFNCIYTLHNN